MAAPTFQEGAGLMTLWWLTFRGGSAVIVEGNSVTHARVLAVSNELGRASQFEDGYAIDPDLAEMIPDEVTWRKLSPKEAADILMMLQDGLSRQGIMATTGRHDSGAGARR
jgi:hypothetical protein